jgi:hypothetical protein
MISLIIQPCPPTTPPFHVVGHQTDHDGICTCHSSHGDSSPPGIDIACTDSAPNLNIQHYVSHRIVHSMTISGDNVKLLGSRISVRRDFQTSSLPPSVPRRLLGNMRSLTTQACPLYSAPPLGDDVSASVRSLVAAVSVQQTMRSE